MNFEYNDRNNTWQQSERVTGFRRCFNANRIMLSITTVAVTVFICLVAFFLFGGNNAAVINEDVKTLRLANIIYRHGARNPTRSYTADPYKNYEWPGGLGALTNLGKQQLYNLGVTMRKRYSGYLPDDYDDNDIYIKSSAKSRTLMSAYTFLAGLYPPTPKQTWNSNIAWQPIPVNSLPRELDPMLAMKKPCSEYDKHFKAMQESSEYQKLNDSLRDIYGNMSLYTKDSINSIRIVEDLYTSLIIQKQNDLKLPEWTDTLDHDRLKKIAAFSLSQITYDDFMIRMKGGPLLLDILQNMKNKRSHELKPNRKLFVYSAHDLTLVNILKALSFKEEILPDYGATLVVELHKLPEMVDFEVKLLFYNNTYMAEPHRLEMPTCKSPCMLSMFEEVSQKYIPVDWEKECGNS
ncbi:prostatic acid phosphatase-like [Arctopsyche grandis]|uniref:prostatic acid phosphatase-like n=1 Tax=Arctopsyche grandis TaxID=121162 RepID=UPI00406D69FE